MSQPTEIDLILTQAQFQTLAAGSRHRANPLSPFHLPLGAPAEAGAASPMPAGVEALLPVLSAPAAVSGLAAILADDLIDVAIYHPASLNPAETVALSAQEGSLRLQKPAPFLAILGGLASLGASSRRVCVFSELALSPLAAWVWWTCLDLLQADPQASLSVPRLQAHLEYAVKNLESLASYAQDALGLELPGESELLQALNLLIQREVLQVGREGTYVPAGWMKDLAAEFQADPAFVTLSSTVLQPAGTAALTRVFAIRPEGGNTVLWYRVGESVTLLGLPPVNALALLTQLLMEPGGKA